MVALHDGLKGITEVAQQMSGSRAPLPEPSPLRTGRDDCSSSGSSLSRPIPDLLVVLMMAPSMQEAQVPRLVPTTCVARLGMMHVHHVDVLIRVERDTTCRTSIALGL